MPDISLLLQSSVLTPQSLELLFGCLTSLLLNLSRCVGETVAPTVEKILRDA